MILFNCVAKLELKPDFYFNYPLAC